MIATSKPLRDAFSRISKLATGRISIPILSTVLVSAKGGVCSLTTTNLDTVATSRVGCVGDLEPIAVPAFAFGALLSAAGDEVKLEVHPNNRLLVKSKSSATLACQDAKDFPAFGESGLKATGLNCADLADAIESVAWAVGDQIDRPIVHGINVVTTAKSMAAMATNGAYVGWKEILAISAQSEWLLRGDSSPLLIDALREDAAVLHLSDKHAAVKSELFDVTVKLMEGKFFDLRKLIVEPKRQPIGQISKQEWMEAIGTIQLLAKNDLVGFARVTLKFEADGASVTYDGDNAFTKEMGGTYQPTTFNSDAKLFSKALESFNDDAVTLSKSEFNLCLSAGDYMAFVALLREKK